jgi:predicted NUDIX family phosphoesterase
LDELVFAVPAAKLWKIIPYREAGLINCNEDTLREIVRLGTFRPRHELEEDDAYKQLITYSVISYGNSFLLFKRRQGQTEKRLVDLYTLGAGGHMNPHNQVLTEDEYPLAELKRELSEELAFSDGCVIKEIRFQGLINDDTINVGRYHTGLFYTTEVSSKELRINETEKLTAFWIERHRLAEYREQMETWSAFITDSIIKSSASDQTW